MKKNSKKKITANDVSLFASVNVTIIGIIFMVLNFIYDKDILNGAAKCLIIGVCCLCVTIITRKIEKKRK